MKNPFGDQQVPDPNSYSNLKERMYKKVSAKVNNQILMALQNAYENTLAEENIVLSRPERQRLLLQIVKMVMEDMLKRFEGGTSSS